MHCGVVRQLSFFDLQPQRPTARWFVVQCHRRVLHKSDGKSSGSGCHHAFIWRDAGRAAKLLLNECGGWKMPPSHHPDPLPSYRERRGNSPVTRRSSLVTFLFGLVLLLAFSSWWHLDMSVNFYHGPRWMGLWNNPNIYGMLMGAGLTLAIGLLAGRLKAKGERLKKPEMQKAEIGKKETIWKFAIRNSHFIFLFVAAGMMGVGLVMSYSRGAWLGAAIGLLYLAKVYGKFKWRFVLPGVLVVAAVVCFFWHSTSDTGPWYLKRMDLSRASAQHRVAAWRGAVQMMRDHPFGVGWNKAVQTYAQNYSPPEGGAAAITTNDYLMLGTQLGVPGLICFVVYVGLCLGAPASRRQVGSKAEPAGETPALPAICRAGALAMLVAFWFDGGLFTLATAAVFWILLELSQMRNPPSLCYGATSAECGMRNAEMGHDAT